MADLRNTYYQVIIDTLISFGITTKDKDIVVYDANTIYDMMEMLCNEIYDEIYEERKKIYENTIINSKKSKKITKKQIDAGSIRKAHQENNRGNLPSGISPAKFFDGIIDGLIDCDRTKDFAKNLLENLSEYAMPSEEMLKELEEICNTDNSSFKFDKFREIVIHLLTVNKIQYSKLPTLGRNEISLQREGDAQESATNLICEMSPLEFSSCFFHAGARGIIDFDNLPFKRELEQLSSVFQNICTIEFKCKAESFDCTENLIISLKEWVKGCLQTSKNRDILKVKGPLGSYKNRLMQYLYLAIERDCDFITPIYIDIASYEKAAEGNNGIDEKDFLDAFEKDIQKAEKIVSESPNKKHLLFLDGIRDFTCKNESLYYAINERIQNKDWYLIVCMDTDFTINNQNKYDVHPLVSNSYECYLRLRSMNLNRKQESIDFIRNCIEIFEVPLPSDVSPEQVYDNLVRLNFLTLDAYWLTYILRLHLNDILNHKNNISGLYNAICLSFLGSYKSVDSASEFAFEFEFGKRNFNNANPYFDMRWRLIRKHRSVLDFLIAKFYIKKVSELNLERGTREQNIEKLAFFNMVLQKSITRFVVTMLKGVDDYERQIMIIAKKYYDELELFGKSELTFWMARLQNPMRKKECVKLLQSYNRKELARYKADAFPSIEEKRKAAFLLRGINVSLIYENDKEALKYYLESLLTDKIANSVNRGFHLEYYGDKPYIPNKSLLDFEDDITSGESTITVICLSLDRRIRRRDVSSPVALLEIMTLCNLIQARVEHNDITNALNVEPYIDKCIRYLEWIMQQRTLKGLRDICVYFHWMHNELQEYKSHNKKSPREKAYHQSKTFNKFINASSVERTGWVDLNVPNPENIVEHMYNCWLLGMLYLPDSYNEPEYCKERILQMLLIHDLGETETGDISRPIKRENQSFYDQQERSIMQGLFLSGTYPNSTNLSRYMKLWDMWDSQKGINYLIAKDIDNVQTIYQFCKYYLKYPDIFSEEDIAYWLMGVDEIETDICKEIADILIVNNPLFEEILSIYNVDEEN